MFYNEHSDLYFVVATTFYRPRSFPNWQNNTVAIAAISRSLPLASYNLRDNGEK
jgi:hypothetical protein